MTDIQRAPSAVPPAAARGSSTVTGWCPSAASASWVIDGPIVTRGYLSDEAATSKSFIAAPAWAADHGYGGAGDRRVH
jgi:acyl-CoA synthetase (AMP-forming)/AMP-acid ligase II